jgi:hypothetical protein
MMEADRFQNAVIAELEQGQNRQALPRSRVVKRYSGKPVDLDVVRLLVDRALR